MDSNYYAIWQLLLARKDVARDYIDAIAVDLFVKIKKQRPYLKLKVYCGSLPLCFFYLYTTSILDVNKVSNFAALII